MGAVSGLGEYHPGATIVLSAVPSEGWLFKQFIIDGLVLKSNPYEFIAESHDINIECDFYVSVEDYLRGSVEFDLPDRALNVIRIDRGIPPSVDVNDVDPIILELCYADVLMWITTTPSTVQGAKDSDNGWSHQEESKTLSVNDKRRLENRASAIYRKYNDSKGLMAKTVTIINLW